MTQDMPKGLLRREGRYSLRRRIPLDLVEHYGGRAEITRALGTSDPAEARRLLARAWVALDEEFEQARRELKAAGPQPAEATTEAGATPEIDPAELAAIALAKLRKSREKAATEGKLEEWHDHQRWQLSLNEAILVGDLEPVNSFASHEAYRNALRAVLTGEGAMAIPAPATRPATAPRQAPGLPLTDLVNRWAAEAKPKERTVGRTHKIAQDFEGLVGKLSVQEITKQHILKFKDRLLETGDTAANVNVKLGMFGVPLNYAVRNDIIAVNPAAKIRVPDNRKAKEKRRAFTEAELERIFASPVYSEGLRPDAGGGEAAYWLPLLSLYTGARQTELGQLHPEDVAQETYRDRDDTEHVAWVIRIVENKARGQEVKTEGSERRIPVHDDLIRLGFLQVAQEAQKQGRSRIWNEIRATAKGELMGNWSKWFGRYRRQCGVTGKDTPFHSFRHAFKHYARLSGVPKEVHNEITGHETGDVADIYGGLSYPLAPLVDGMQKYRVPGFKLPAPPPSLRATLKDAA